MSQLLTTLQPQQQQKQQQRKGEVAGEMPMTCAHRFQSRRALNSLKMHSKVQYIRNEHQS